MSRDDSDRISDFFAAGSRDLTPASARHAAHVLYAPVSGDPEVSRLARRSCRMPSCREPTALQPKTTRPGSNSAVRFAASAVLPRSDSSQSLSEIVFEETENGRPYLSDSPDFWFSFSSCRFGVLGAWSSTHAIGVDVEDHTKDLEATELAQQFFSVAEVKVVEEAAGLNRLRTFYQFWSLKEAALKSIGEGLPFGLDAFEFELGPETACRSCAP